MPVPEDHVAEPSDLIVAATSFLFVPGDRPDRFDKAVAAGAATVILDLEDAVAPGLKPEARLAVASWLKQGGHGCVRVSAAATQDCREDLASIRGLPGLVAIVLAKADAASAASVAADVSEHGVPVIALIESAAGVASVREVARTPGIARLAFGHLDYALDIGASPSRTAMLQARSQLVLASRLAGLPAPIDGVTTSLDDEAALLEDLRHAEEVGMGAKLLVHPRQVAPTIAAFRPGEDTVRWAHRVLGSASSGEAVRVDGEMVDAPVIARAQAILRRIS